LNTSALVPTHIDLVLLQCAIDDKTFYAVRVPELPTIQVEARSQMATYGDLVPLSNVHLQLLGNGGAGIFADPITWIGVGNGTPEIAGVSIFQQQGNAPSEADFLFSTIAFLDSAGLPLAYSPDGGNLTVNLNSTPFFVTRG
jgi:hypothetical protein